MKRLIIIFVLCGLLLPTAYGVEKGKWFCVAEMSTGFHYDAGRWKQTSFTNSKYILRQPSDKTKAMFSKVDTSIVWVLVKVGDKVPQIYCDKDFGSLGVDDELSCNDGDGFKFNRETLRYARVRLGNYHNVGATPRKDWHDGYFPVNDDAVAEPYVEIGNCVEL